MAFTVDSQVVSDFRAYYPEFADTSEWPDADVTRYLEEADSETGSTRWGQYKTSPTSFRARGLYAYAAHKLVLSEMRKKAVAAGQAPQAMNQVSSKQVGDESIQYAVPQPEGAQAQSVGDLDSTLYGQEFLRLRRRAGTGAATTGSYW
jgi:hypothetical protein